MTNLVTISEVISLLGGRGLHESQLNDIDIRAAQRKYCLQALGADLYADVVAAPSSYTTLLTDYLKPIISYGVLKETLPRLAVEVSDRGVFQVLAAQSQPANSPEMWQEVRNSLDSTINELIDECKSYCKAQKEAGNPLFADYVDDSQTYSNTVVYKGESKRILKF